MGLELSNLDRKGLREMKTNVIYIHTHDSGRYMEPYGAPVKTPNIMNFSRRATTFRNAHCAGPTCSPSRAGLLTGQYPHCSGMLGLAHRGFSLNDYSQHMVTYFNQNGFETALSGIQHVSADTNTIGYRKHIGDTDFDMSHSFSFDSEKYDLGNALAAADYIKEDKDSPFFLSFGMFNTHRIFPEPDISVPQTIGDNEENRNDMAGFHQSLSIVDKCMGIIMDALDSSAKWDNTIVLFTTDHGMPFPGMKCTLSDQGTGVTFIMHYPGNPSAGKSIDALVSHIDVFPTYCDILNLPEPEWLQGVSLLPVFTNPEIQVREEIFSEISFHAAYEPVRSVRTNRFKLIKRYDPDQSPVPANADGCPAKNDLKDTEYYRKIELDRISLFDLKMDPLEKRNLVGNDQYKKILGEMELKLLEWMEHTDDPLLKYNGVIPIPRGGLVNKRDCVEPKEEDFITS
jgi:N-sulfoglucosamine sulfohydrolase